MPQSPTVHRRPGARVAIFLAALLAVAAVLSAVATAQTSKRVVSKGQAAGSTVLTASSNGHTLYTLSAETHGRFICTGSCLKTWFPLVVAKGVKPTGPVALGVVKRPDGSRQVSFEGRPLYTFDGDTRKGQAGGEGFKDVGTWHAAKP